MMQENTFRDAQVKQDWHPLGLSEIAIRKIGVKDLWQALKQGFDDFNAKPSFIVFLFVTYPLFALLLTLFVTDQNLLHLALPMVSGFTPSTAANFRHLTIPF